MLVSIRRSLVAHVEDLGRPRNTLRRKLQLYAETAAHSKIRQKRENPNKNQLSDEDNILVDRPIDQVLEGALSSLGRCIELVRPAGLFVSSVSKTDWVKALNALELSMSEIRSVCDPDRPLHPSEWGKLVEDAEIVRRMHQADDGPV